MLKSKPLIKLFSLVIASSLTLSACGIFSGSGGDGEGGGEPTTEEITLEYWRLFDDSDALDPNIAEYQEDYPNVNVNVRKIEIGPNGYDDIFEYRADVVSEIAAGNGPDIFQIRNNWVPKQEGHVTTMPSTMKSVSEFRDLYPQVVEKDFLRDGEIYALPLYIDNLMLFYNPQLFREADIDEPPQTWEEAVDMVPDLTKIENGELVQSAITLGVTSPNIQRFTDILAALMLQNGAQMSAPGSDEILLHLPHPEDPNLYPASQALEFYTSFADPDTENFTYTDQTDNQGEFVFPRAAQAFIEGRAAMFIGYQYHSQDFKRFAPDLIFNTAPLPQVNPENPVTIANYWGEVVSNASDHPDTAWHFLNFLSTHSEQYEYSQNTGRVSPRTDFENVYQNVPIQSTVYEQIEHSDSWYVENIRGMEEVFAEMVNNVLKNDMEPRTAVDLAVQKLRDLR